MPQWCPGRGGEHERFLAGLRHPAHVLLDAEHAECVLVGDSTTDVLAGHLAGVAVIGYADKPGKTQALADVQAAAVTTDLAEITTALRNTA
jgi:beta-phosphoglucomutase-like phosphatase (HAD superfamily)